MQGRAPAASVRMAPDAEPEGSHKTRHAEGAGGHTGSAPATFKSNSIIEAALSLALALAQ